MKQILLFFAVALLLISCNDNRKDNTPAMSERTDSSKVEKAESKEERNKKVIKSVIEALNSHNVDDLVKYMATDVVDYGDGSGRPVKNVDSLKATMNEFLKAFPDFHGDNLMFFADGDYVVVIGEWSGTFKNSLGKMKATGKQFKLRDADIFKLNDEGKIVEHRYIQPDATLFGQVAGKPK